MPETPASDARVFDALAREFFSVWFRFHPEAALAVGVQDYADLLPPQSDDDQSALGSLLETLIVALEELDHEALDAARRLDAELLFSLARVEHQELLEHDWRRRDPLGHLPLMDIHRLTLLRPASLRHDLLQLLEATASHLRLALTHMTPMAELIPPPLVAAAINIAEAGPAYLRELARSRWLRAQCHGSGEIETAAESAASALLHYAGGLRDSIAPRAAGRLGCGAPRLRLLLRLRHRLDVEPEGCSPLLERLDASLAAATPTERTPESVERSASEAADGLGADSMRADGIWAECNRQQARLAQLGLLSLPSALLQVAGGPACPRVGSAANIELATLGASGPGIDYMPDLVRGNGTLYVADGETCKRASRDLLSRCCVSLGWGGLHTLTFAGGMQARSLPRLLADGTSLCLGLPLSLYGQLFGETAPETLDARRRAVALARLDLALHVRQADAESAHVRAAALGEPNSILASLIRRPGDALATVLGWQLIDAARKRLVGPGNGGLDTRGFHDGLVAHGPIPAAAALTAMHGKPCVEQLIAQLMTEPDTR